MSFWFLKFSKKTPKNFCPRIWKMVKSTKYKHFLIILWLYGLFNVLKTLYGAVILWFEHFLDFWAEICQIFRWFFGKFTKSKKHSEIIWPLACLINWTFDSDGMNSRKIPNLFTHFSICFVTTSNHEKGDGLVFCWPLHVIITGNISTLW